jgi:formylglycine-generating enzyme required for sulfatase activity
MHVKRITNKMDMMHLLRAGMLVLWVVLLLPSCGGDAGRSAKGSSQPVAPVSSESFADLTTGMEFTGIKGGCFQMGDIFDEGGPAEKPVHTVCVGSFAVGKREVTVGQFTAFVNATGYATEAEKGDGCHGFTGMDLRKDKEKNWRNPGFAQTEKHPVVCVSWNDAKAFTDWLSATSGTAYRLLTEAEWEYAARSGGKSYRYAWGKGRPSGNIADESLKRKFRGREIWDAYDDSYVYTGPTGSFKTNESGIYDMTGNVWEWVNDWYDEGYYKVSPKENPGGPPSGEYRLIRGGGWLSKPEDLRVSNRFRMNPSTRIDNVGFRVAAPAR